MKPADPRDSGKWRALRARMRRTATHCAICGTLLDHTNPRGKRYPQVDHIVPLDTRPDLAFVPSNLRVLCAGCNCSLGARHGNRARRRRGTSRLPRHWQPPRSDGDPDGDPGPGW